MMAQTPPAISRAALEAYEQSSGLKDVAAFLIQTGRVIVAPSRAEQEGNHNGIVATS